MKQEFSISISEDNIQNCYQTEHVRFWDLVGYNAKIIKCVSASKMPFVPQSVDKIARITQIYQLN